MTSPAGPGRTLDRVGLYRVQAPVGAGGMGWVYRATDTRTGSDAALKVIHPHLVASLGFAQRFAQACEAGSGFRGAAVVRQLEAGEADGFAYVAMEFVTGTTLRDVLKAGPLAPSRVQAIALQVCDALAEAESLGVVHRDIKPENVLIGPGDAVKVADFGIARLQDLDGVTPADTLLGSAPYMAPERAAGASDARSGIYALGIVLYEMAAGRTPFTGTILAQLDQHRAAAVPAAPLRRMPPSLQAVILRCLEKRPADRFASAREVRAALAEGVPARGSTLVGRIWVSAAAIVLGGLGAVGVAAAMRDGGAATPPGDSSSLAIGQAPVPGPPPAAAEIISPPPGSTLPSGPVTFTWSAGVGMKKYDLQVSYDPNHAFYDMEDDPQMKATVPVIPPGEDVVLVRLSSADHGVTAFDRWYTYTAPGRTPTVATVHTVKVHATGPVDTGIDVPEGARIAIFSSGGAFINSAGARAGPRGDPDCAGNPEGFLAPRFPCYALVGRVGDGPWFLASDSFPLQRVPPGRLYLSLNDDNFFDNRGSWSTTIVVATPAR